MLEICLTQCTLPRVDRRQSVSFHVFSMTAELSTRPRGMPSSFPHSLPVPAGVSSLGSPPEPFQNHWLESPFQLFAPMAACACLSVTLTLLRMAYLTGVSAPGVLAYIRAESLLCSPVWASRMTCTNEWLRTFLFVFLFFFFVLFLDLLLFLFVVKGKGLKEGGIKRPGKWLSH
jgi:hypothetical protein